MAKNTKCGGGSVKKFALGFFVACILIFPLTISADSMIGKQVQMIAKIKLDGEYLEVDAIGINGTTYAPVRALAEALGKEVEWDPVNKEVIIDSPETIDEVDVYSKMTLEELEKLKKSTESRIKVRQQSYEIEKNRYENDPSEKNAIFLQAAKESLEIELDRLSQIQSAIDALTE